MMSGSENVPVLVTGGTGTLGRQVVARLRQVGRDVRVLTRRGRPTRDGVEFVTGDLATGEQLDAAVDGVETILHLAGSSKGDADKAGNLVDAVAKSRTPHIVYISVVGCDQIPVESTIDRAMFGYFAEKHEAERLVAESGLPWTTLRATQFHDLILTVAEQMSKLPLVPFPSGFQFQPIGAEEVADRLVQRALASPAGLVPEIGGPQVQPMDEMLRAYLRLRGKRRPLVPLRVPGKAARAFRAGANLTPERSVGRLTWEQFLADRVARPEESSRPLSAVRS